MHNAEKATDKPRTVSYSSRRLPAGEYLVAGLIGYASCAGQGDIEHQWTWLCTDPEGETVLLTEIYNVSVWSSNGPEPGSCSANNLYQVRETFLPAGEETAQLKYVCGRRLQLPFVPCLTGDEKLFAAIR